MRSIELTSKSFLLLKLLDKIDRRRDDYDQALAADQYRRAADFLKQIKRLVCMVDQIADDIDDDFVLDCVVRDIRPDALKSRASSKK